MHCLLCEVAFGITKAVCSSSTVPSLIVSRVFIASVRSIWLQPLDLICVLCTLLQEGCCLQAFQQGLSAPCPQHVGTALALAHFLDHMYHHRPAKRVEASPWFEAANSLVQDLLTQTVKDAPKVQPLRTP